MWLDVCGGALGAFRRRAHKNLRETRQIIDKAVNQKEFMFTAPTLLQECAKLYGNRAEIRAEKWACTLPSTWDAMRLTPIA